MDRLKQEITMELLTDLATAVRHVMADILPSLSVKVAVVSQPKAGIMITVDADCDPIYPRFVDMAAVLRPSKEYRRLLGLPERETAL